MATSSHHRVLIVGGGTAGISVAARLRHAGVRDIGLIEPAATHYYQPLWTLVGGGRAPIEASARPQQSVIPKRVSWIRERAEGIDPDEQTVSTDRGSRIGYDRLIVCPGIQLASRTRATYRMSSGR
jgi:sulfide:quinone oxidoreductase